jgi:hypothetical protein
MKENGKSIADFSITIGMGGLVQISCICIGSRHSRPLTEENAQQLRDGGEGFNLRNWTNICFLVWKGKWEWGNWLWKMEFWMRENDDHRPKGRTWWSFAQMGGGATKQNGMAFEEQQLLTRTSRFEQFSQLFNSIIVNECGSKREVIFK